jgi:hypothetical protein
MQLILLLDRRWVINRPTRKRRIYKVVIKLRVRLRVPPNVPCMFLLIEFIVKPIVLFTNQKLRYLARTVFASGHHNQILILSSFSTPHIRQQILDLVAKVILSAEHFFL